jgi:hypothetical protein
MSYGAGITAYIWTELFKDVHFLEYNEVCGKKMKNVEIVPNTELKFKTPKIVFITL